MTTFPTPLRYRRSRPSVLYSGFAKSSFSDLILRWLRSACDPTGIAFGLACSNVLRHPNQLPRSLALLIAHNSPKEPQPLNFRPLSLLEQELVLGGRLGELEVLLVAPLPQPSGGHVVRDVPREEGLLGFRGGGERGRGGDAVVEDDGEGEEDPVAPDWAGETCLNGGGRGGLALVPGPAGKGSWESRVRRTVGENHALSAGYCSSDAEA